MNFNAIVAVLVLKGIIPREEAEALVEYLNHKPQSTLLADTIEQIQEFVTVATAQKTKAEKSTGNQNATAQEAGPADEVVKNDTDKSAEK